MASIDRYVLDFHACQSQADLNAFWNRVPAGMEDAIIDRLNELFPADPNECDGDPYRLRQVCLNGGLDEFMSDVAARAKARCCAEREGRTVPCERCDAFLLDYPAPED